MPLFVPEDILFTFIAVVLFFVSASTLWWMLHDWNNKAKERRIELDATPRESFTLIVPARHEEQVLEETLFRLSNIDHPALEILVVVGHDDTETQAVAARVAEQMPERFRLVVDTNWPKNKPKALNTALPLCRGSMIGIIDAEDEVSPEILYAVERALANSNADVVQAAVQLVDLSSRWFSIRNCLEYFFWYRSRMHAHSLHGVMPLGGNTVFMRRRIVEEVGGWDADCLAEDCDIGIRLSAAGYETAVVYDPHVATREETPATVISLLRQRTRWNQGFLQVLRKHGMRTYPLRRQRLLAGYLLSFPFLQAIAALLLPLSVVMILSFKLPVGVTLIAWLPLVATAITTATELVALRELCADFYLKLRFRYYLILLLSTIPYQIIMSFAAIRAVYRELRGEHSWEKTAHVGAHRLVEAVEGEATAA